ncbi:hypothetical protein [Sorangium sp. So ce1151]|uniref:hypothetical protein n=1 Tax=Sorangium sp. So ce1151 TaxID=3133332 RepID=UPI003F634DA1
MNPAHPARLERWLGHPHFFRAVLLLAAVLAAPSIAVGFYADDYHFFAFLSKRYPGSPPWYDLYRFFTGDARTAQALIEMSGVPWWTDPEVRIHLVRPLASALLALQRALFGDAPLPYHLVGMTSPEALSCWSILSMTKATHRLTRTGASSLALAPVERPMLTGMFETLYRSPEAPLRVGDAIRQCDATVRVAAVEGGRPTRIEVELGTPLDDPELVLLTWRDGRLRRVAPPAVGEVLELPWSIGPTGFF